MEPTDCANERHDHAPPSSATSLHERLQIPIDVFLTTSQVVIFASDDPALLTRLVQSPVVALSYHLRAPKPYASNYDWIGLSVRPLDEQISIIANYETHGLDLVTGQPTEAS